MHSSFRSGKVHAIGGRGSGRRLISATDRAGDPSPKVNGRDSRDFVAEFFRLGLALLRLSHAGEIRRDFPNYSRRLLMLSIRDVAKTTGVPVHKIRYALATGRLPEPGRAGGRRCFLAEDIEAVRRLFQSKKK
jgi:hypothetical protein